MSQITERFVLLENALGSEASFTKSFSVRTDTIDGLANHFEILAGHGDEFGHGLSMFGDGKAFSRCLVPGFSSHHTTSDPKLKCGTGIRACFYRGPRISWT